MRPAGVGRACCGGGASNAQGGPNCGDCCGRARAERTINIPPMCVTLDVFQLIGWLNFADCRVER